MPPSPYREPNQRGSAVLTAPVTEGQFIALTGSYVNATAASSGAQMLQAGPCAAAARPYAWAETGGNIGDIITWTKRGTVPVKASANLTAGQDIQIDASAGAVGLTSGVFAGTTESAIASGAVGPVAINL